ncbi:glutamine amidotransferase [Lichenihabitans sp. Uapishka_5]|uniref:glutamine amidotransferase n=1 Tax=Lichenihabitans sp. Uapishka_5 TaxID=3037302 RepID=UPI0029E80D21|nr:glutamine amidotransferase [Lichenihabitans sp. Uapishka_5]MDX7953133.1 glutamine amidotransferase [Lichenihabitans sp. Uapishka_5]
MTRSAELGSIAMQKPVLVVLHQEHSSPARIGRLLRARGYPLDIRRPRFGDPLPPTMAEHAGAVIFGGPMSANDPDDFIKTETDWIGVPLREGVPFLGVCLGAQLFARHLGEKVYPHPAGRVEVGYYPITPTAEAERLFGTGVFPRRVYQWHREGFDLPRSASLLASGLDFEVQACHVAERAFALQFHPEVTYAMMCAWTVKGHDRMTMPGAWPTRQHHLDGWFAHDAAVARWLDAFLGFWISRGRDSAQPATGPAIERAFPAGTDLATAAE